MNKKTCRQLIIVGPPTTTTAKKTFFFWPIKKIIKTERSNQQMVFHITGSFFFKFMKDKRNLIKNVGGGRGQIWKKNDTFRKFN